MQARVLLAVLWASVCAFAADVEILNTEYLITQGDPFTLRYKGCENTCSIALLNANNGDVAKDITNNATGTSYILILDFIPIGTYVFRLAQKADSGTFTLSPTFGLNGPAPGATRTAVISGVAPIPTQTNSADSLRGMGTGAVVAMLGGMAALL